MASNKITDFYRSRFYKQKLLEAGPVETDYIGTNDNQEEMIINKMTNEKMIQDVMILISEYNNEWIRIFQMKIFEELSFKEISKELGISENTVKTRYYTMIKMLKKGVSVIMENKYKFDIEYPTQIEKQNSINFILDATKKEEEPLITRLKNLFLGPGINVIFYQSKLLVLMSLAIYLFAISLGYVSFSINDYISPEYMIIIMFPVINVSFFALSMWNEEQSAIVELKRTLKYSQSYIITLRMLYVSILAIVINEAMLLIITDVKYQLKIVIIAFATSFIFSVVSLWLYDRFNNYYNIVFLCIAWIVGTTGISKYNSLIINTMLNTVPTVVCVAIAAISFGIFIAYLRKVEKENAYA